ncbi:MAG: LytR C-terminal domain-containing protein [Candidatus Kryptoniota bacterium]
MKNRRRIKSTINLKKLAAYTFRIVVVGIALLFVYSFLDRLFIHPPARSERTDDTPPTRVERVIQVSVENECGQPNVALIFTNFLRRRGFDVVESGNGSTFDRQITQVVDAAGNLENAKRVASALGVDRSNVVQKIDPHAYVDVKVLIGKDFSKLKPKWALE